MVKYHGAKVNNKRPAPGRDDAGLTDYRGNDYYGEKTLDNDSDL
jgi:hypothetical protein